MSTIAISIVECNTPKPFETSVVVDDPTGIIIIGNIYYISGSTGEINPSPEPQPIGGQIKGCYIVTGIKNTDSIPNAIFSGTYNPQQCETCLLENAPSLLFTSCFGSDGKTFEIYVPSSSFSPIPQPNDVFLLSVYYPYGTQIIGCFEFTSLTFYEDDLFLEGYTAKTDCQTCLSESPINQIGTFSICWSALTNTETVCESDKQALCSLDGLNSILESTPLKYATTCSSL